MENKLVSDRALSNLLKPVVNRNRNITFPYTYYIPNFGRDIVKVTISSGWNSLTHFTLDVLTTEIYRYHYGSQPTKNWKVLDNLHQKARQLTVGHLESIQENWYGQNELAINSQDLKEKFEPFRFPLRLNFNLLFGQYREVYGEKRRLVGEIKKIGELRFQLIYPVRLNYLSSTTKWITGSQREVTEKVKFKRYAINVNRPSRLLLIDGITKDGCDLKVATAPGILLTQNILTYNVNVIDPRIGYLNDVAAFIYRKLIAHKGKMVEFDLQYIYRVLEYENANNNHKYRQWVKAALESMINYGLIKGYSIGEFNRYTGSNKVSVEK